MAEYMQRKDQECQDLCVQNWNPRCQPLRSKELEKVFSKLARPISLRYFPQSQMAEVCLYLCYSFPRGLTSAVVKHSSGVKKRRISADPTLAKEAFCSAPHPSTIYCTVSALDLHSEAPCCWFTSEIPRMTTSLEWWWPLFSY